MHTTDWREVDRAWARRQWWSRLAWLAGLLTLVLALRWSLAAIRFQPEILGQGWLMVRRILAGLSHPAVSYVPTAVRAIAETTQIAIVGTTLSALLAVPFGFLAAVNVTGRRFAAGFGKNVLNVIRAVPDLLLAIIFMKGVGFGPFAGVLAIGVHGIGTMGKLYAELVEASDPGPVEALASTGANRVQQVWYGILPQVLPDFASQALYRLEINMRSASVLGMVGAGGIGVPLLFNLQNQDWGNVSTLLLGIVLVVSAVDYLSAWLRSKIV